MSDHEDIYAEVRAERERAHAKHGDKSMESWAASDYARLSILMEEVGEVAREFNDAEIGERDMDLTAVRAELIQVAAMAVAWADAIGSPTPGPCADCGEIDECRDGCVATW